MNDTIQGLWVGDRLSMMERISISSFLKRGHPYHLYVYGDVLNVPAGATVRDAREILPPEDIFRNTNGSLAGFANMFRYKLLLERGGWWADLDVVCLRPFEFDAETVIASEHREDGSWKLCAGILKAPRGSGLMRLCLEKAIAVDKSCADFGATGYEIFIPAVRESALEEHVVPPGTFCPLDWWQFDDLVDFRRRPELPGEAFSIHLWNEMWNRSGLDKDRLYDPESLYGGLQRRYSGCDPD